MNFEQFKIFFEKLMLYTYYDIMKIIGSGFFLETNPDTSLSHDYFKKDISFAKESPSWIYVDYKYVRKKESWEVIPLKPEIA